MKGRGGGYTFETILISEILLRESNGLPIRDGAAHLYEAAGEALRDAVLPVVLQQMGDIVRHQATRSLNNERQMLSSSAITRIRKEIEMTHILLMYHSEYKISLKFK
jgi:hypothetical protein